MFSVAIYSTPLPVLITIGAIGAILIGWWGIIFHRFAIGLLLGSLVVGQLVRIPLPGQGGGVLVSDVAVILVLISALFRFVVLFERENFQLPQPSHKASTFAKASADKSAGEAISPARKRDPARGGDNFQFLNFSISQFHFSIFIFLFSFFLLWSLFTLVIHAPGLGAYNALIAGSYWVRLSAYLLLVPSLLVLFKDPKIRCFAERGFIAIVVLLVMTGLLQVWLFPSLDDLPAVAPWSEGGWDPHEGRLVSTWLDPNFFGMYIVLAILYTVGSGIFFVGSRGVVGKSDASKASKSSKVRIAPFSIFLFLFSTIALILTQSRSSTGAFLASLLLLSPIVIYRLTAPRNKAFLFSFFFFLFSFFIIFSALAVIALGDRALGILQIDETMRLRLDSLQRVWTELAQNNSAVGVGYNAYQFAAKDAGLISDFTLHSRAGADSSILTLWVTTGLPGVVLFFLPWAVMFSHCIRRWLAHMHYPSIAAAGAIIAITAHSLVVNSFLYAHLLAALALIVAFALSDFKEDQPVTERA